MAGVPAIPPNDHSARSAGRPGSDSAPSVWHVSEIPGDFVGREAIPPTLELVTRELSPLAATFFAVGGDGEIRLSIAHGPGVPQAELSQEVRDWKLRLRGIDPLAPEVIARMPGPIATLRDVDDGSVRHIYEEIGVVNDVRLLIRDGDRLVAGVTLWQPFPGGAWSDRKLRVLAAFQPLIEMAYLSSVRMVSSIDARLPATLTGRQHQVARLLAAGATNTEVARALYVSPETAKSHTRAVLSKLGLTSRREMVLRFPQAPPGGDPEGPSRAPGRGGGPSIRLEGDRAAERLLAAALAWSAAGIDGVSGGCAFYSARLERVAEAWGSAGAGSKEPDPRVAWRVHRRVLPPTLSGEVVRYLDDLAQPVVQLDLAGPPLVDDSLGELVARLGLTIPLLAVLRGPGRIAGLIWLCRDPRAPLDQRKSARMLRGVHPLLELGHLASLPGHRTSSTPGDLADRGLTTRELAVARLALDGESNAAIARRLRISESTVKRHMSRVLAKCGVRSRTQLIALFG